MLADFAVLVVRPTLIDLSGLARTLTLVRKLGKPSTVVMNRSRSPARAYRAAAGQASRCRGLDYIRRAPVAPGDRARPVDLPDRAAETGHARWKKAPDAAAAEEIAALWEFVEAEIEDATQKA